MQISKNYIYFYDMCDTLKTIMIEDINYLYDTKLPRGIREKIIKEKTQSICK